MHTSTFDTSTFDTRTIVLDGPPPADATRSIGVGIDTARYGHRVAFLRDDRQPAARPLTVLENAEGYDALRNRLQQLHQKHPQAVFQVHLDAAGQYAANLERFLRSLPLPLSISIGEPLRNQRYHKVHFPKRSTDDTESQAMARFGVVEHPRPTPATPEAFALLRDIAARLQAQVRDNTRAINRFHNQISRVFPELEDLINDLGAAWVLRLLKEYPSPQAIGAATLEDLSGIAYLKASVAEKVQAAARKSIGSEKGPLAEALVRQSAAHLLDLQKAEKDLKKLLLQAYKALPPSGHVHVDSIPGVGPLTAAVLVAKIVSIDRFATPDKLVGYFGIFPEEESSGVDRKGRPLPAGPAPMSRKGCDLVRGCLWNAAKSASRHNAAVKELYDRLRARGTRGDVALGHCMRKLLHQVYGVWIGNRPFDVRLARTRPDRKTDPPAASATPTDAIPTDAISKTAISKKTATPTEAISKTMSSKTAAVRVPKTETVAGHNREVVPESSVVTATASRLEPVSSLPDGNGGGTIDYRFLREQIGFERILSQLGVLETLRGTTQRRGRCPLCQTPDSFSVNLQKNVYQCFHDGCSRGNVLDFWSASQNLSLYKAAQHLAQTFRLDTHRK